MNPFTSELVRKLIKKVEAVLALEEELKVMAQDIKDNQSEIKGLLKKKSK